VVAIVSLVIKMRPRHNDVGLYRVKNEKPLFCYTEGLLYPENQGIFILFYIHMYEYLQRSLSSSVMWYIFSTSVDIILAGCPLEKARKNSSSSHSFSSGGWSGERSLYIPILWNPSIAH
jgi:hypothetical protein